MKLCALLLLLFTTPCFAQKVPAGQKTIDAGKPAALDSATYNFLFPVIKMIQVAEDPKKGPAFLMKELQETDLLGTASYQAPFSFGSFKSTLEKMGTDRVRQTTTWRWRGTFFVAPKDAGEEVAKNKKLQCDSLLKLLKYKSGSEPNSVKSLMTFLPTFNKPFSIIVWLDFTKGIYNTEQQAFDSLEALYKPLLSKPAFAANAASRWGYALEIEGFDRNKITGWFQEILAELANTNSEAAFQMLMGIPDFMDYAAMNKKLPGDKQSAIKAWAKKEVDNYYEAERRKVQGDPVMEQQKKIQTDKILTGCSTISEDQKYKYQLGITMITTSNGTPFIVRLTAIDCRTKTVTITKPGKRSAHDFDMRLPFEVYERYKKYDKQFHRCTQCGGEGGERVTTSTTRTKELPFGYFSGIETKSTRTTTNTVWKECYKCDGTGWVLQ
ncbi:MAG TPA: hypothetical protein PKX31_08585 [Chitinophagaceae bacterium]|nr:hypothetical protein [Chitinophagaceae bacterium]